MKFTMLLAAVGLSAASVLPASAVTDSTKVVFESNEGRSAAQAAAYGFITVESSMSVGGISRPTNTNFGTFGIGETNDSLLVLGETANGADGFRFTFTSPFKVTMLAFGEPAGGGTSRLTVDLRDDSDTVIGGPVVFAEPPAFIGPMDLFAGLTSTAGTYRILVDGISPRPDYDLLIQAIPAPAGAFLVIGAFGLAFGVSRRRGARSA